MTTDWDAGFVAFKVAHPPIRTELAGVEWEYLEAGAGPPSILLLPGGLGVAESSFRTIERLETRVRVIAPTILAEAAFLRSTVDDLLRDPRPGLARLELLVDLVNHPPPLPAARAGRAAGSGADPRRRR